MKNKIFKVLKKYRVTALSAIIILLIGILSLTIISLFFKNSPIKKVNDQYYAFVYDNTWKLKEKHKNMILLKHSSGSKIIIQITELSDEYRYSTIDELIDEIIYNIEEQNKGYNLISKQENIITKFKFEGYKLLYENNKEQVMMNLYKKSDKLISIRYEASNDYFDILLDSVHNIVNNLDIKDENFDLKDSLKLEISDINFSSNEELDKTFVDSEDHEIASNNYYVKYTLPSNFVQSEFNSNFGSHHLKMDSGNIDITVNIYKKNIYEYLDKEEIINVYKNYDYYHKKDTKDYTDFKESLAKLESDYDSYVYKNSYYKNAIKYDKDFNSKKYKRPDENVELIYALNNSHTLIIQIKATGLPITEKLIDMIKIKTSKNYASYIEKEKDNNYLIGTFKRFSDYNKDKIDLITLKIPDKYEGIDKNVNLYLEKNYGLNYNEDMKIYDYNVHYELSTLAEDKIVDIINDIYITTAYGEYHYLQYSGKLTLNGKEFKVYDGGYTNLSGILFTNINRKRYYVNKKILFYEMANNGNFYIEINGNGKEITNEMLNELVNFTVEEKDF